MYRTIDVLVRVIPCCSSVFTSIWSLVHPWSMDAVDVRQTGEVLLARLASMEIDTSALCRREMRI
jgi:hypothetical protein